MTTFSHTSDTAELAKIAHQLRLDVLEMLHQAGSGHIGGPFGMADIFAALYFSFLNTTPLNPSDSERDYCLLSNGHICPIYYAALARRGFFPMEELGHLRKIDSLLQGHPKLSIPGVENSSGPLGHGLSQAVGIALALKMEEKCSIKTPFLKGEKNSEENKGDLLGNKSSVSSSTTGSEIHSLLPFKKEISKQRVICCMSDGEHQEGQTWEAVMSANKWNLGNLIAIMDYNNLQIEGTTDEMMPMGDLAQKYRIFGWEVREIDGHNFTEILEALHWADKNERPTMIVARTILGKGVSFMENNWKYHDWTAKEGDYEKALAELSSAN